MQEPYASLILAANQSQIPIFSIDIPSGLDGNTGQIGGIAVKAQTTIFLSLPKTGFFYHIMESSRAFASCKFWLTI